MASPIKYRRRSRPREEQWLTRRQALAVFLQHMDRLEARSFPSLRSLVDMENRDELLHASLERRERIARRLAGLRRCGVRI